MGLLAELRTSYQNKLNKDRIDAGLKPLKFDREEKAWEKDARLLQDLPAPISIETESKIFSLSSEAQKDVERYRHIFKNSPKSLWKKILKDMGGDYEVVSNFPDDHSLN